MNLYEHQVKALEETKNHNKVAFYLDMGLGKTFVGSEKMVQLNAKYNLLVCQKSKIDDWYCHFKDHYDYDVYDLTKKDDYASFVNILKKIKTLTYPIVGIINYDLLFRRKELLNLKDFTLMLDESSIIQNESSKRSKFIDKMEPQNVILLSGTPTSGKYENLYSQLKLLGWDIDKKLYWKQYIETEWLEVGDFKMPKVVGYKNVDRLKDKLKKHGAIFMKTEEVLNLPEQIDQFIKVEKTKEYKHFLKHGLIKVTENGHFFKDDSDFNGVDVSPRYELVGDTILTKRLYLRMLASGYNYNKLEALKDLFESTNDRLIVFYNFNQELEQMLNIVDKPISIINGEIKDLRSYEEFDNSVTFVQFQAGAKGLNLQKSNKIIYFSPTQNVDDFMQSKKRVHRIGQSNTCFYYYLITDDSIDCDIYKALEKGMDYVDYLFEKGE